MIYNLIRKKDNLSIDEGISFIKACRFRVNFSQTFRCCYYLTDQKKNVPFYGKEKLESEFNFFMRGLVSLLMDHLNIEHSGGISDPLIARRRKHCIFLCVGLLKLLEF